MSYAFQLNEVILLMLRLLEVGQWKFSHWLLNPLTRPCCLWSCLCLQALLCFPWSPIVPRGPVLVFGDHTLFKVPFLTGWSLFLSNLFTVGALKIKHGEFIPILSM